MQGQIQLTVTRQAWAGMYVQVQYCDKAQEQGFYHHNLWFYKHDDDDDDDDLNKIMNTLYLWRMWR